MTYLLAGHIYLKLRQSKCTRLPVDDRHTSRLNFINVQRAAFTLADPECEKKDSQVGSVVLCFWDLQS